MNFKATYILFGVLVILLGFFALVLWLGPGQTADTSYVLPTAHDRKDPVRASDIDTVTFERTRPQEEMLVFARDSDGTSWRMTKPYEARLNGLMVGALVNKVLDARRDEKRELSANLKQWELDPPAATVTIKHRDGREWKMILGGESGGASGVIYVTSSDRPKEALAVKRRKSTTS